MLVCNTPPLALGIPWPTAPSPKESFYFPPPPWQSEPPSPQDSRRLARAGLQSQEGRDFLRPPSHCLCGASGGAARGGARAGGGREEGGVGGERSGRGEMLSLQGRRRRRRQQKREPEKGGKAGRGQPQAGPGGWIRCWLRRAALGSDGLLGAKGARLGRAGGRRGGSSPWSRRPACPGALTHPPKRFLWRSSTPAHR